MSAKTVEPQLAPDPPGRGHPTPRFRRRAGAVLDRWPFRRKLNVLVILPIAIVGALLGVGVDGQAEQARAAGRTAELVRDSEQVARLINDIQAEHRQALLLSVQYESARPGADLPSTTAYRRAQRDTDAQVAAVRSAFGSSLGKEEAQALQYIGGLAVLHEKLERTYVPAANIDPAYASAVDYLIDGIGLGRIEDTSSSSVVNLLNTVLRADAAHAAFESSVFSAQTRDANAITEFTRAVGAQKLYEYQFDRFVQIATPGQVLRLDGIRRSAEQNGIASQFAELQVDPSSLQGQRPEQLQQAIAAGTRQAETRLGITRSLIGQIAAQAETVSENALRKALVLLGLALLGFVAWLTFCVLVRRSVVRPLATLTDTAQQVVDVAGEELARVSDDESADSTPLRPQAIPVPVRDEIGKLAEAFNQVQVTAAQLLERQVLSRRNVAEMFGNVGRRVSNLTSRQLILIDAVEREETDPDVLERLYRIDHIAVRLQRNADSLMLLAGIRETGVEAQPTTMANVIRAALGQIEGFQRVSLRSGAEATVTPDIIGDLTLMLAELLENAVTFSPSHAPVEVVVRPGTDITPDGGALIEVVDHGLGMSAERLTEENARLIRRERLDLVPTKVLGLFVVGTLARRWGIRVTLSRTPGGGITGTVWIPSALLLSMNPENPAPSPATDPAGTVTALPVRPKPEAVAPASLPVPAPAAPEQQPAAPLTKAGLPRRVRARTGVGQTDAAPDDSPAPQGRQQPLRRRVRGATLAMAAAPADGGIAAERGPVDADAVRSELEEFEAAVRQAEQDSTLTQTDPAPPHQEPRKESGSDHADR
ncbi:HAMP domain-containing protein [Actinoallomurus purpureus]|uniref:sensor histidine kinase n=1 Tax=Actinoallomurus purpureus TaxID=478114 RepID=UPI002093E5BD|nr:ATP-binding protein [Actinoallomurus purpureus]MCO6006153.1 HAMP domain-containing protein [Actinoallomurus purpureus]